MKKSLILLSALFLTTASWASQGLTQLSFVATATAPEEGEEQGTIRVNVHGGFEPYHSTIRNDVGIVPGGGQKTGAAVEFQVDADALYYVVVEDETSEELDFLQDQLVLQNIEVPEALRLQAVQSVTQLDVSVQVTNVSASTNGAISVNVKGGIPNFKVELFNNGALQDTILGTNNQRAFEFSSLQAGNDYIVQVTDSSHTLAGLSGINQITSQAVTVSTCTLDIVDIDVVNANCTAQGAPGSITVELSGDKNFTVELSGPCGDESTIQKQQGTHGQTIFPFPNLPAGFYSIRATDCSFCEKIANGIEVKTSTLAFSTTLAFTGTPCSFPALLTVTVTGGVAPVVTVTGPGGFNKTDNTAPFEFELTVAGTYQITVTDAGCVRTGSIVVELLGFTTVVTPVNCTPNTPGSILVTVTGGFTPFTVTNNGSSDSVTPLPGGRTFIITPLQANSSNVIVVTDNTTGCTATATIVVPLNDLVITSVTTTPQDFCEETGGTITVVVTGGENLTATATSSTGEVFAPTTTVPSGNSTTFTFTDLPAGRFTVTVTNTFDEPNVETCSRSVCAVVSSNNSVLNFLNAKFCGAVC